MADESQRLYIALYTDADVHGKLAALIRQRGFDAISAYEARNADLDDQDQLRFAAQHGRAILTCNAKDFVPLLRDWWQTGSEHSGVIISEQLPLADMLHRVLRLLDTVSADDMQNSFRNLGEYSP
jgi:hypothetical protein